MPSSYIEEYGASYILNYTGITDAINSRSLFTLSNEADYMSLLSVIEDPGIAGDMFTSSGESLAIVTPLFAACLPFACIQHVQLLGILHSGPFTGQLSGCWV